MTLAVLFVPLVLAMMAAFLRDDEAGPLRVLALLGSVLIFVLTLFLPGDPGVSVPWIPGFGAYFALDPAGAGGVLVQVAALVMIPTALYASFRVERRSGPMLAMLFLFQAALFGLFLARDLLLFYLFWEAALVPTLVMLGVWGRERRRQATLKYLVYAVAGSFLMLLAILALKPLSGAASYRFADLLAATPSLPVGTQGWLFLCFTLAFAVKLPLWPVHSWLPDVNEQNHPSGVADVAGTLYKVGGWGFFAWALPLLPAAAAQAAPVLLALAAVTALYAAVIATQQNDLKRLLAFASLSHMGIVGVGIFGLHLAGLSGAVFLLAAQMVSTGGLFLLSGMLYQRRRSFALESYGGLARSAPALAGLTLFVLFASIGVPGLSNFPGEFMSLLGSFQSQPWWAAVATLAVIAAGIYGVNAYQRLYQAREEAPSRDLSALEVVVLVPILAGILWLGLAPAAPLDRIERQARFVTVQQEALAQPPGAERVGGVP